VQCNNIISLSQPAGEGLGDGLSSTRCSHLARLLLKGTDAFFSFLPITPSQASCTESFSLKAKPLVSMLFLRGEGFLKDPQHDVLPQKNLLLSNYSFVQRELFKNRL